MSDNSLHYCWRALMRYIDWPIAFVTASIVGGVVLTLLSGFHMVKPLVMDAEIIHFGFPFAWLEAGRSTWTPQTNWGYDLIWQGFFADFVIHGFVSIACTYIVAAVHPRQKMESIWQCACTLSSITFTSAVLNVF